MAPSVCKRLLLYGIFLTVAFYWCSEGTLNQFFFVVVVVVVNQLHPATLKIPLKVVVFNRSGSMLRIQNDKVAPTQGPGVPACGGNLTVSCPLLSCHCAGHRATEWDSVPTLQMPQGKTSKLSHCY
ncbi:hypothetical protein P4O66_008722 [Electrophorus voltai]|uniref:Uncharacterized protein n=1 Tax=Electrophorus voltai TaxID=2609070 RepID=A0AAD8ZE34_9TELE|nr:hypothetical protein P4O66_008722 [Electrophorus voltai]